MVRRNLFVLAIAFAAAPSAAALAASPMVKGTCVPKPEKIPPPDLPAKANALQLLQSLTQLQSTLGRPVLKSNLATTVAVNNSAPPEVRERAIRDAQVTAANANTLADGLGARMGAAYRDKARFESDSDGKSITTSQVGPATEAVILAAMKTAGTDSAEGKCAFANGVQRAQTGTFQLPPGGVFDVIGKAYDLPAGSKGADIYGNSRPFQTASIHARSGPHIETYDGTDFFGVGMNSRVLLEGPTEADLAAGRYAESLVNSPSYPSGHTTFAYTEALLLALLVPERYQALAYRASEYGNSRIALGAHYAVDVIGGRTLATYDLSQSLAGTSGYADVPGKTFRSAVAAAADELRGYLQGHGCPSIAACAAEDPIVRAHDAGRLVDGKFKPALPHAAYAFRLNYGLTPIGPTEAMPEPVPPEAGLLLATRFPYLTQDQRREILKTTEGPSGYFLDANPVDGAPLSAGGTTVGAQAGVYSRLDLFAAAGGPVRLEGDLAVDQDPAAVTDPDLRPFSELAEHDTWSNDISGSGGLIKRGGGTLRLTGAGTFAGDTRIEGGTLDIAGSIRSPIEVLAGGRLVGAGSTGDVSVAAEGALAPTGLKMQGELTLSAGASFIAAVADPSRPLADISGPAELQGASLKIDVRGGASPGYVPVLRAAGGVRGKFAKVELTGGDLEPRVTYGATSVSVSLVKKGVARAESRSQ